MATNGTNGTNGNGHPKIEDIVIVGGSLGGLMAGVALKTHGYNTTILERTNAFLLENQGAGIVAGGDTIEYFKKYDRTGKPVAVPSYKRLYLNKQGDVIYENEQRQNMTSWDLTYYLLRANYDRVESGYLQGAKLPERREGDGEVRYRYGCTVTDVVEEGEVVRVVFKRKLEDGTEEEESLTTKLLVAADGPSSTTRSILEQGIERKYAGYVVIRGTVPEAEASQEALDVFRERFCFVSMRLAELLTSADIVTSSTHRVRLGKESGEGSRIDFWCIGIQNLTYTIAGENGNTEPGHRLLNFVWYANFDEGSEDLERIMTDKNGRRRRITIPPGA
ncbi:uncharacterized protein LTR77_000794 [Saxophila tyrrhenica]|uniref:FAD-binding domain-containing protein n=1 Tax=Saxophila tyrrhenica TaxID=1690608 RepID=A0AAV9PTJ3_9PEZI|nr:hypothetical protein LTR77_000794 [Saxophila tyrrhenica]